MRFRLLMMAVALPLALWSFLPLGAEGQSLSSKIERKREAIESRKGSERVLTSSISGYTARIGSLQADITQLAARQARLQSDLDRKLARLSAIQTDLRAERARLARLRARLAEARVVLARRMVDLYKADNPDVLTVVLNSDGFADLLERSEFARRVGQQDQRIIVAVQRAKADATRTAARLEDLEAEAKEIAASIEQRRDEVVRVKDGLAARRDQYAAVRDKKRSVLASVRSHRHELEGDLQELVAQERQIQARLAARAAAASGGGSQPAGPVRSGSGGVIWPVNGPIVSPFGPRWGRLHAGVDIAVPNGTPVRAATSGSVAIAGWVSGYGNLVCVQQGSLSTCSAHNTSISVSVGQRVSQGAVIASSGCTGHCFGPHVHFETRVNGSPVDPMGYL